MDSPLRHPVLGAALVLSLGAAGGLVTSTIVASRAYRARGEEARKTDQVMTVTGSARKRITSDLAVWNIRVEGEGKDLAGAFAVLKAGIERVRAFLESRKFEAGEVAVSAIDTEERHVRDAKGHETNQAEGYLLRRTFTVTTVRVDRVAAAAGEVTELIQEGIRVVSLQPEYHYTQLGALKVDMIGEATKDAVSRARQIVENSGARLGDVRNARMGVLQITRPNSTEVTGAGVLDTTSIDKDAMAVVSLTMGIDE